MLVKWSRILKTELNEWYRRLQAERITWRQVRTGKWTVVSPGCHHWWSRTFINQLLLNLKSLFLVKALFAFRRLCVNADIHLWLGMGGRTSGGGSGIRKPVPHLLTKVGVSSMFPFPWCEDSHHGWLEVTNIKWQWARDRCNPHPWTRRRSL